MDQPFTMGQRTKSYWLDFMADWYVAFKMYLEDKFTTGKLWAAEHGILICLSMATPLCKAHKMSGFKHHTHATSILFHWVHCAREPSYHLTIFSIMCRIDHVMNLWHYKNINIYDGLDCRRCWTNCDRS